MEQDEFLDRVSIEHHRKYIESIHKQLKRKNAIISSLRIIAFFLTVAIVVQIIYLFSSLQNIDLVSEKINNELIVIDQNFKPELLDYSINGVKYEIHQGSFKNALIILKALPDSDDKDWYSGLTFLGLNDFDNAEKYLTKINNSEFHTYHNELNLFFCSRLYLLKVRNYIKKNKIYSSSSNIRLSLRK